MSNHSRKKSLTEILMEGDDNAPLGKDVSRERAFSNTDSRSVSSTKATARKGTYAFLYLYSLYYGFLILIYGSNIDFSSLFHKASFDIRSLTSADDHASIIKNLDDVKPFEEEAETTILRAIEKQDKEREKLKDEDRYTQGILQGVPVEAAHLFSDVINDDEHIESNQRRISSAPSKRDVIRPMVSFFFFRTPSIITSLADEMYVV